MSGHFGGSTNKLKQDMSCYLWLERSSVSCNIVYNELGHENMKNVKNFHSSGKNINHFKQRLRGMTHHSVIHTYSYQVRPFKFRLVRALQQMMIYICWVIKVLPTRMYLYYHPHSKFYWSTALYLTQCCFTHLHLCLSRQKCLE